MPDASLPPIIAPEPLFPLGQLVVTSGALHALARAGQFPAAFLIRHAAGDWGDLLPEDLAANDRALHAYVHLLSRYFTAGGEELWVITEPDRSVTTLLLPIEY
jgi:hypothetical protein